MNLQTLELFLETVETGSFSEVARRRGINRSQVGRIIAQLEEELEVELFQRHSQLLVPTPAAEIYRERVEAILQDLQQAADCLKEGSGRLQGTITIAASLTLCTEYLVPRLASLREAHPLLVVQLLAQEENPLDLSRGKVDLGLQNGPRSDGGAQQLQEVTHKVYAPAGWQGSLEHPAQLAEMECMGVTSRWKFTNRFVEEVEVRLKSPLQSSKELVVKQACLAGLGPAVLPEWMAEAALQQGQLVELMPDWSARTGLWELGIWAIWPGPNLSPKARAVLDLLVDDH